TIRYLHLPWNPTPVTKHSPHACTDLLCLAQANPVLCNGYNITEFLEEWNIECEDFGLTETQRCARFPNYCTPEIKETVKILPGYIATNWITLQSDVKKLYWPQDKPKNTIAALDKLLKQAPGMD